MEIKDNELFERDSETNALVRVMTADAGTGEKVVNGNELYIRDAETNALVPVVSLRGGTGSGSGGGTTVEDGAAWIPDYAAKETINRITASNGTWTVDRDGFVLVGWDAVTTAGVTCYMAIRIFINNVLVDKDLTVSNVGGTPNYTTVLAVKKGDVVRFEKDSSIDLSCRCYYIPPVKVIAPKAENVAWIPDYAAMETTNRISANNGTWTVDRDGFVDAGITNLPATVAIFGFQVVINGQAVGSGAITAQFWEHRVFSVKKGDIVKCAATLMPSGATMFCYYVPPVGVVPATMSMNYTEAEQDTGKIWIDGKKIYRRVTKKTFTAAAATTIELPVFNLLSNGVDTVVDVRGWWQFNTATSSAFMQLGSAIYASPQSALTHTSAWYRTQNDLYIQNYSTAARTNALFTVIIEYTKI